jgi:hypothetical protein
MALSSKLKMLGISLDKIPNIKAFDIDKNLIEIAKKGRINISEKEYALLDEKYRSLMPDFFNNRDALIKIQNDNIEIINDRLGPIKYSYQYNPKLLEKINFYVGVVNPVPSFTCVCGVC